MDRVRVSVRPIRIPVGWVKPNLIAHLGALIDTYLTLAPAPNPNPNSTLAYPTAV